VAENMLTAHPDLNGIFCSNESGTKGSAQAIKARGGNVKLVGFDSSPLLKTELKAGIIDSLVIQDPFGMGETAVDEAVKAIEPDVQAQLFPDLQKYLGEP
jgi:ribose transport system substrate-binding protein